MFKKFFSFISAPATEWIKSRKEIKMAKHNRELAIINNQTRLAQDKQDYNHQWEMESLKGNSKGLRAFCYVQITLPMLVTMVAPDYGAKIWENLKLVPDFWVSAWVLTLGGIWGAHELKGALPAIVAQFKKDK